MSFGAFLMSPAGAQAMLLTLKAGRAIENQLRLNGIELSDSQVDRLLADRDALNKRWADLMPKDKQSG